MLNSRIIRAGLVSLVLAATPVWAAVSAGDKVNINKADVETLDKNLKYVGKKIAGNIVAYRKAHGEFKRVEDMTYVRGVGERTIKANRNILSVE